MTNQIKLTQGLNFLFSLAIIFMAISCDNDKKEKNYDILSIQKSKNSTTAYVVYNDTNITNIELQKVLIDVNRNNKDSNLYFTAFLFTSLKLAENDKSEWIARLEKDPNNPEPQIAFNEMKLNGIKESSDNAIDENDIALSNLKTLLAQRNIELCDLYIELSNMELNCSGKADAKYPEKGGLKHHEYYKELIEIERKNIADKYNLNDSIFTNVAVFAMTYCK